MSQLAFDVSSVYILFNLVPVNIFSSVVRPVLSHEKKIENVSSQ